MADQNAYLRTLLDEQWALGEAGKGVVLLDGTLRTWRTLSWSGPHHQEVLAVLNIGQNAVAAYLDISAEGSVTMLGIDPGSEMATLVAQAVVSHARLRMTTAFDEHGDWSF